jgi:hypothetical protein
MTQALRTAVREKDAAGTLAAARAIRNAAIGSPLRCTWLNERGTRREGGGLEKGEIAEKRERGKGKERKERE